jgi:integrase
MRGSIRKRASGSWTLQVSGGFDDAGKRVRLTKTVRGTERDAQRALTKLLRDVDQGQAARAGATSFGSYLIDWWLPHMRSRVGAETWDRYEGLVRVHLVPRCGRVKLAALRPHHLQAALDRMLADGAAPASVAKAHRVAAQALGQAVRWQLLPSSPAAGVSPPRASRKTLRIPTAEETRTLVSAAQEGPYGLAVLLAATTGMRRGEILGLRWDEIDLDAALLRVRQGKTPRSRRTISLPPFTVTALRRHRKDQAERRLLCGKAWQDSGLVVDRGDGRPVHADSLSHAFAETAERIGLADVRLHDLRHAFATTLLAAGVNVKVVSEALGHASTAFTMDTYAHVLPTMGEQVAHAIEFALGSGTRGT